MGNVIMSGIVPPLEKPVGKTFLSSLAEGSIVKLNENGSPTEFFVAKHNYESGLNGAGRTLLVRTAPCEDLMTWTDAGTSVFEGSNVDTFSNETYVAVLDSAVQNAIGETVFKYNPGPFGSIVSTIARKAFALSITELGFQSTHASWLGNELPVSDIIIPTLRLEWTRTLTSISKTAAFMATYDSMGGGSVSEQEIGAIGRCRPCLTLPATLEVAEDGTIIV